LGRNIPVCAETPALLHEGLYQSPIRLQEKAIRHHLLVRGLEFVHLILRSHCHPNFSRPRRPDGPTMNTFCFAMALAKVNAGRPTSIMKKLVWLGMNLTFFLSRNSKVFSRIPLLIARRASSGVRHLAHRELVVERQRSTRSQQTCDAANLAASETS
jgi:hypothetical protein